MIRTLACAALTLVAAVAPGQPRAADLIPLVNLNGATYAGPTPKATSSARHT
jgi:hypothetical protein